MHNSIFVFWSVFIIAWSTDTFAYFVGKLIGKRKLTELSPKKTIEGSLGGVLGCIITLTLLIYFWDKSYLMHGVILGFIASPLSQVGDLIASKIKREFNLKDYGKILPGHGGILDRFDSVIFVSLVVFIYNKLFIAI